LPLFRWPDNVATAVNAASPLRVYNPSDDALYDVVLSAGPGPLNGEGRTEDLVSSNETPTRGTRF
jgi:hypothetical protein